MLAVQQEKETDRRLEEAVVRQLDWEPQIISKDISVSVHDGVVSLTGFVHSYAEKFSAEKAVKKIYGVLGVANDIAVKVGSERSDPEIARAIVSALENNVFVPDHKVTASVRDGSVTLEGTVDWNYQKESAENTTRTIAGVRGIVNMIRVKPNISPIQVKAKIEDALRRSAEVDARRITVTAEEGTVHLYGNVHSWTEKDEAQRAAWNAAGVSKVVNHLHIVP